MTPPERHHGHAGRLRLLVSSIVLAVPLDACLRSQELPSPSVNARPDTTNLTSLGFDRLLNTFFWTGGFHFGAGDSAGGVLIDEGLRSRLIRSDITSKQDEYTGLASWWTNLDERWRLSTTVASSVLTDSRSLDIGSIAQHRFLEGLGFSPVNAAHVQISGGYELNTQATEHDRGLVYGADGSWNTVASTDEHSSLQSGWSQSLLGRRDQYDGNVGLVFERSFEGGAFDSLGVQYSTQRREFYTTADTGVQQLFSVSHNIFRRDAGDAEASNQLRYPISRQAVISVDAGLSERTIDRAFLLKDYEIPSSIELDSRIQELELRGAVNLSLTAGDWLETKSGIAYSEREERHSVVNDPQVPASFSDPQVEDARRLENISRTTTLFTRWNIVLSDDDLLKLQSSSNLLQYDTPDTLNTDDRDELLITASLEEVHRFSRYCTLTTDADVSLNHLVYLSRFESANNTWNRVIRFSPVLDFTPALWLRSVNRAEVLANYTVFDFEDQVASVKSFAFRQAAWSDSSTVQLTSRINLDFTGGLRWYERGILRWQDFKERPEDYFVEKSVWPKIVVVFGSVRWGLGYRYFSQDRYAYAGTDRMFEQEYEIEGPTIEVDWERASTRLTLEGWRENQTSNGQSITALSNLTLRVSWAL